MTYVDSFLLRFLSRAQGLKSMVQSVYWTLSSSNGARNISYMDFVFLFNGISNFVGYLIPKLFLKKQIDVEQRP